MTFAIMLVYLLAGLVTIKMDELWVKHKLRPWHSDNPGPMFCVFVWWAVWIYYAWCLTEWLCNWLGPKRLMWWGAYLTVAVATIAVTESL